MNYGRYISSDPDICGGTPCIKGTRIPVYVILEDLMTGVAIDDLVSWRFYPHLNKTQIKAALSYAAAVAQKDRNFTFARS